MISSQLPVPPVDDEARRLEALGAAIVRVLHEDGLDHYRSPWEAQKATSSVADIQDTRRIEEATLAGDVLLCEDLTIAQNPLEVAQVADLCAIGCAEFHSDPRS
jgi:hypothetical protein